MHRDTALLFQQQERGFPWLQGAAQPMRSCHTSSSQVPLRDFQFLTALPISPFSPSKAYVSFVLRLAYSLATPCLFAMLSFPNKPSCCWSSNWQSLFLRFVLLGDQRCNPERTPDGSGAAEQKGAVPPEPLGLTALPTTLGF